MTRKLAALFFKLKETVTDLNKGKRICKWNENGIFTKLKYQYMEDISIKIRHVEMDTSVYPQC